MVFLAKSSKEERSKRGLLPDHGVVFIRGLFLADFANYADDAEIKKNQRDPLNLQNQREIILRIKTTSR